MLICKKDNPLGLLNVALKPFILDEAPAMIETHNGKAHAPRKKVICKMTQTIRMQALNSIATIHNEY